MLVVVPVYGVVSVNDVADVTAATVYVVPSWLVNISESPGETATICDDVVATIELPRMVWNVPERGRTTVVGYVPEVPLKLVVRVPAVEDTTKADSA